MSRRNSPGLKGKALPRAILMGVVDVISILVSFFAALWVRFDFQIGMIPQKYLLGYEQTIGIWCAVCVFVFLLFRLYSSVWSFASVHELFRVVCAYGVLAGLGLIWLLFGDVHMPQSYYLLGMIFSLMCTTFVRFFYRLFSALKAHIHHGYRSGGGNIMVIGAGEAGKNLIREFSTSEFVKGNIVCVIDDNPAKRNKHLCGIPVVGDRQDIPEMVKKYKIESIMYAIPSGSASQRKEILDICATTGCKVQVLPGIYQLANGEVCVSQLREVDPQDLLGRDPIKVNLDEIFRYISGKVVMVTGGGGSIGNELCRQIARAKPEQLIIFDIYENSAYDIQMELNRTCPELNLKVLIGSVRNTARLDYVLGTYRPELVFHAAVCGKFDTARCLTGSIYCAALVNEAGHSIKIGHLCPIYIIRGGDRSADVSAALAATLRTALGVVLFCFPRHDSVTIVAEGSACAFAAHAYCRENLYGQIPSERIPISINRNVIYIKRYRIGRGSSQVFCHQL